MRRSCGGSYLAGGVVEDLDLVCLSEGLHGVGVPDDAFGSYRIGGHAAESPIALVPGRVV